MRYLVGFVRQRAGSCCGSTNWSVTQRTSQTGMTRTSLGQPSQRNVGSPPPSSSSEGIATFLLTTGPKSSRTRPSSSSNDSLPSTARHIRFDE